MQVKQKLKFYLIKIIINQWKKCLTGEKAAAGRQQRHQSTQPPAASQTSDVTKTRDDVKTKLQAATKLQHRQKVPASDLRWRHQRQPSGDGNFKGGARRHRVPAAPPDDGHHGDAEGDGVEPRNVDRAGAPQGGDDEGVVPEADHRHGGGRGALHGGRCHGSAVLHGQRKGEVDRPHLPQHRVAGFRLRHRVDSHHTDEN